MFTGIADVPQVLSDSVSIAVGSTHGLSVALTYCKS